MQTATPTTVYTRHYPTSDVHAAPAGSATTFCQVRIEGDWRRARRFSRDSFHNCRHCVQVARG